MSEYETMSPKQKRQAAGIIIAMTMLAILMIWFLTSCSKPKYFQTRVSQVYLDSKGKKRYMFYRVYNKHYAMQDLKKGDTICIERKFFRIK